MSKRNLFSSLAILLLIISCKKHSTSYKTLTLQPANNPNEVHIFGNNKGVDETSKASYELDGVAWTVNNGIDTIAVRAAFQFDLSSIPQSAVVDSSRLSLFSNPNPSNGNLVDANFGTGNALLIQQITSPWNASTVSWINQPNATTDGQTIIPSTNQSFLDLPNIDVTAAVSNMVKSNANYGFLMRLQTEAIYNSRIFCSSKYSDTTKHPKLVVYYHITD